MARAKQKTGIDPLSYMGVDPASPNNFIVDNRDPEGSDYRGYELGDEWLNVLSGDAFKLVSKSGFVSTWTLLGGSSATLTFNTDGGSAVTSGNAITIAGGTNINTAGAGATVTTNLDTTLTGLTSITTNEIIVNTGVTLGYLGEGVVQSNGSGVLTSSEGTDGQLLISSSSGAPAWANITSSGATITITNGSNSINLEVDDTGFATQFDTDSGSATPAANIIEILGGTGVDTSATGNTVTINADGSVALSFVTDSGTATPASNIINILGGTDVDTAGVGSTVTINSTGGGGSTSAFSAILSADLPNEVGDDSFKIVPFDSELFDTNNDFDTSTGEYTAPVNGVYSFVLRICINNITNPLGIGLGFSVNSGPPTYIRLFGSNLDPSALVTGGEFDTGIFGYLSLSAGDTVGGYTKYKESTITNTAGIKSTDGTNIYRSWFQGHLVSAT
jgi:hypothetical protein